MGLWFNDMYDRDPSFPSPWADYDVRKEMLNANNPFHFKFRALLLFPGGKAVYDKISALVTRIKRKMTIPKEFDESLKNPDEKFFSQFYSNDRIWIRSYFQNIGEIVKVFKKQNPNTKFYIVAMPTLLAPGSSASFSKNVAPPAHNISLYFRSYLSQNASSRLLVLSYYYHTVLFSKLVESRKKEYGYDVILGYPSIGRKPLQERPKYFADEIHLMAPGNLLLAQEISRRLLETNAVS